MARNAESGDVLRRYIGHHDFLFLWRCRQRLQAPDACVRRLQVLVDGGGVLQCGQPISSEYVSSGQMRKVQRDAGFTEGQDHRPQELHGFDEVIAVELGWNLPEVFSALPGNPDGRRMPARYFGMRRYRTLFTTEGRIWSDGFSRESRPDPNPCRGNKARGRIGLN